MLTALRIAVADDEPDLRDYYQKMLPRLGHEVVSVASTGRELVNDCFRLHPDLVITDQRMPDMDGIAAVELINQELHIPVILITAVVESKIAAVLEAEHIITYLIKPIKMAELAPAITHAIERFERVDIALRELNISSRA